MWRSFFLAIGLTLCILGGECLVVDKAYVAQPEETLEQPRSYFSTNYGFPPRRREFVPPEWAPWSLLVAGAVVSLYSVTLARDA